MNQDLIKKIRNIVSEGTGVEASELIPSAEFETDLNLNQLEVAEMVAILERKLDFEMLPGEINRLRTFGQLIATVQEKIEE